MYAPTENINRKMPFNLALVGPAKVGKTRMMHENLNDFILNVHTTEYVPTVGIEVHPYEFDGNFVYFWDFAGNPKFIPANMDKWLKKCDVVALFHDGTPSDEWIQKIRDSGKNYVLADSKMFRGQNDVHNWVLSLM